MAPLGIGVVGTGDIAPAYLAGIIASDRLQLRGCAGRNPGRTAVLADRFATRASTIDDLLGDPAVELIVNLTTPRDHAALTRAALVAGKHVYSEKPLALDLAEADALIDLAEASRLILACAPATPLGPAQQTARRLIDEGAIGDVVGAATTMVYPGPQLFHANPAALFAPGAGPLFDMGVYDIAALCALLGPVAAVSAMGRRSGDERQVLAGPNAGDCFPVQVPTHIVATLRFAAGPLATMTLSFDGFASGAPGVELIGTTGTLRLPPANRFDGEVALSTVRDQWRAVDVTNRRWSDDGWIIGLLDTAAAIRGGHPPSCSALAARHHLAVLAAIGRSIGQPRTIVLRGATDGLPSTISEDDDPLCAANGVLLEDKSCH